MALFGPALIKLVDHLKSLDGDTVTLVTRFLMRGVKTGDLNGFVKRHLGRILDDEGPEPVPTVRATSKVVR